MFCIVTLNKHPALNAQINRSSINEVSARITTLDDFKWLDKSDYALTKIKIIIKQPITVHHTYLNVN